MYKYIAFSLFCLSLVFACKKKNTCDNPTTKAPDAEITTLQNYITSNSIVATKDGRGFFYKIETPGGTDKPTNCKAVNVKYTGQLTDGSVFDQSNGATFGLSNLILGWQEGIPLIGKGGKIILYLPPSLAYGSQSQSGIPANSILIFTIELLGF